MKFILYFHLVAERTVDKRLRKLPETSTVESFFSKVVLLKLLFKKNIKKKKKKLLLTFSEQLL